MLKACRKSVIDKAPKRFVIAGHFTRADMTTFSDFSYFKRRLSAVRKTYATTEIPVSLRLASNEGPVHCRAVIIDTMLLASGRDIARHTRQIIGRAEDRVAGGDTPRIAWTCSCAIIQNCSRNTRCATVIPALWVVKTYGLLLDRLNIKKKVVTLGGAAIELVKGQAKAVRHRTARVSRTGQKRNNRSRIWWR